MGYIGLSDFDKAGMCFSVHCEIRTVPLSQWFLQHGMNFRTDTQSTYKCLTLYYNGESLVCCPYPPVIQLYVLHFANIHCSCLRSLEGYRVGMHTNKCGGEVGGRLVQPKSEFGRDPKSLKIYAFKHSFPFSKGVIARQIGLIAQIILKLP